MEQPGANLYNLLMAGSGWEPEHDTMTADRVFEYTSKPLEARFMPNGVLDVLSLTQLPTLFTQEVGGEQPARVGRILQATLVGKEYRLDYMLDPDIAPIPNAKIKEWAGELGLEGWETSRTHWAVKDVDLYKFLFKRGLGQYPKPTVFNLGNHTVDEKLVAVMMPFDAGFTGVTEALKAACARVGMGFQRADDIWINDHIMQDVVWLIAKAKVVICDLSGRNPNVFYEMGIAHTLGKDVIMISQSSADVPFDVKHIRYVPYLKNTEGLDKLAADVAKRLETLKAR